MHRWILFLLLAGGMIAERAGNFRVIGPGGGGAMFHPAISPHDPNTVLVSCDMTGAYITHDGGGSWRMFNLRGTVQSFVFDPKDPNVIYAQVTGLWRSQDRGATWHLLYPRPAAIQSIRMDSDHADETLTADPDPLGTITALAIDPADSRTLLAAARKGAKAALFVSHDAGGNWQQQVSLPEAVQHLWIDARSRRLFAGAAHAVIEIEGSQLRSYATPEEFSDISAGLSDDAQPVFYGVGKSRAYVSTGGSSWRKVELPGEGAKVRAIAASLHHPQTAYLSYNGLKLDGHEWFGVARTNDTGRTWKLVWKEGRTAGENIHDAWITARFGPGWAENPLMLSAADQNANLVYSTDFGRTMRTSNGGDSWQAVYSRRIPGAGWATTGLDVTTNYGIHFDPFDLRRQFITYTDIGLFRSEDNGVSWASSTEGVPRPWVNTTYWIVFDPAVRGRAWSVNSGTHDLPRPKMWRHNSVLSFTGGVCRSEDGGATWTKSNEGMPETAATHILLDPASPVDARVLYVTGFGRGVFKSADGGRTWKLQNHGITQDQPFAWRLARAGNGVLYLIIARRSENGSIGNSGDGALYRSSDGAENWSPVSLPQGVNGPNGLAVDAANPARLYLAAWARAAGVHGEGGGIYLSEDAGKTWRRVLERDQHVYDVSMDPRDPKILYAAGFESSAWISRDRGENWSRISGYNFKWGHRVIPDPQRPGMIYVTTFGGSVWHGFWNAAAQALDIATPELDPGR